jgi:NTE family protein
MDANIVLAGGGAKGAVLAGCVNAVRDKKIRITGCGGTSAGALIAFLVSIGYTGDELRRIICDTPLTALLDDDGRTSETLKWAFRSLSKRSSPRFPILCLSAIAAVAALSHVFVALQRIWNIPRACLNYFLPRRVAAPQRPRQRLLDALRLPMHIDTHLGLLEGARMKAWLLARLVEKHVVPSTEAAATLTFCQLAEAPGCKPLRVVATDVRSRRAVIFGDASTANAPVVDAVIASARFPILFKPQQFNGWLLTDGGLSSNLPSFLFTDSYERDRTPTLAFDLIAPLDHAPSPNTKDTGVSYLRSIAFSALEASDVLLRESNDGIEYFAIEVPPGVDTFSFDMSREKLLECYTAGYAVAAKKLEATSTVSQTTMTPSDLRKSLAAKWGIPAMFAPVLRATMDQVNALSGGRLIGMRAHIMILTPRVSTRGSRTRIVVYSHGMKGDGDAELELDADAGCSGFAWKNRRVTIADLEKAREHPKAWGMTDQDAWRVPERVHSMVSAPIMAGDFSLMGNSVPIGTISVDCQNRLADTSWVTDTGNAAGQYDGVQKNVETVMQAWADVLAAMIGIA